MNGKIYMYTNLINGKKYIGQTICPIQKRLWEHVNRDNSYIDRALRKYGIENFKIEILEENISNREELNQREIYYIKKFNSFEDGYNLTKGGEGSSHFNEKLALKIINEIKNSNLTFKEIGINNNVSIYTVSDINIGNICYQLDIDYPIRKNRVTQKYNNDDYEIIALLLRDTQYSYSKISELYEYPITLIQDINRGKRSWANDTDFTFPIRKNLKPSIITKELCEQVIPYLLENKLSADQIGDIFNISGYTVGQINRGTCAISNSLPYQYPIRKRQHRNIDPAIKNTAKINLDQLKEIIELLINTNLNLEEIAQRYGLTRVSIDRINQGKTWSKYTEEFKKPIRQNKVINQKHLEKNG